MTRLGWILGIAAVAAIVAEVASTVALQSAYATWSELANTSGIPESILLKSAFSMVTNATLPVALAIPASLLFARAIRWEREQRPSTSAGTEQFGR